MKKQEAIEKLREFCKLRTFCELYPDACQKDKCEIYMAIEALSEPSRQGQRDGLIKRQVAIDANCIDWCNRKFSECPYYEDIGTDEKICDGCDTVLTLKDLPSAQPQRKSVNYYGDGYSNGQMVYDSAECPCCGYIFDENDNIWGEPYCPHCGQALDWYMRGEQDE